MGADLDGDDSRSLENERLVGAVDEDVATLRRAREGIRSMMAEMEEWSASQPERRTDQIFDEKLQV